MNTVNEYKKTDELTQLILRGSRNIDRMRKETMDVCNALMGMMLYICKTNSNHNPIKEPKWDAIDSVTNQVVGTWIIFRERTGRMEEISTGDVSIGDFAIIYLDTGAKYNPNDRPFVATPGTVSSKMAYVQWIHACLPSLVAGIEARFQFLKSDYGAAILTAAHCEKTYF